MRRHFPLFPPRRPPRRPRRLRPCTPRATNILAGLTGICWLALRPLPSPSLTLPRRLQPPLSRRSQSISHLTQRSLLQHVLLVILTATQERPTSSSTTSPRSMWLAAVERIESEEQSISVGVTDGRPWHGAHSGRSGNQCHKVGQLSVRRQHTKATIQISILVEESKLRTQRILIFH